MDPRLVWTLTLTLLFVALVVAGAIFMIIHFTPIETPVDFREQGLMLREDGTVSDCEIALVGKMVTYHRGVEETPHFATNPSSSKQGLFLNDRRLHSKLVLPWESEDMDFITYLKNGRRFFVNRELNIIVIITADGRNGDLVAVAPAGNMDEVTVIMEKLTADPYISENYADECAKLLTMLENSRGNG